MSTKDRRFATVECECCHREFESAVTVDGSPHVAHKATRARCFRCRMSCTNQVGDCRLSPAVE